jgi:hypothetical protein
VGFWQGVFSIGSRIVTAVRKAAREIGIVVAKGAIRLSELLTPRERLAEAAGMESAAENSIGGLNDLLDEIAAKETRDRALSDNERARREQLMGERARASTDAQSALVLATESRLELGELVTVEATLQSAQVLQAHIGQMIVDRICPNCGRPIFLQRKRDAAPDQPLSGFFWSCSGYYVINLEQRACLWAMDFASGEAIKFEVEKVNIDLRASYSDLREAALDKSRQDMSIKSIRAVIELKIQGFVCPEHRERLYLKGKVVSGTLLNSFYLRCNRSGCRYTVPIKTLGQVAEVMKQAKLPPLIR